MNRGRRRGGVSSGFANLRDGVKRRLFDPHLVPVIPDPQTVISRLTPITTKIPSIDSVLYVSETNVQNVTSREEFLSKLFEKQALVDFIFESSPDFRSLPTKAEGLEFDALTRNVNSKLKRVVKSNFRSFGAAHLLLQRSEIEIWRDGTLLSSFSNPLSWYPDEIAERLRPRKVAQSRPKRARLDNREDLSGLVSDQAIAESTADEEVDEENPVVVEEADEGDKDSEDARWNGDQPAEDDEDEEELENDYCETYFDNGEGDVDDVLRDDDEEGGAGGYFD